MDDNKDTKVDNVGQEPTVKTYTKEDIDNSFNAGVKKANSDWQKDEKYKEFLEWKKNSQSESEKISELQTNNNTLTNENKYLKSLVKVNESNVKKEFSKFVTSEVMSLISDTVDFDTALNNYKKENPHFFGDVVIKKVQSSPNLNGGIKNENTTNSIMNDIIRNARK